MEFINKQQLQNMVTIAQHNQAEMHRLQVQHEIERVTDACIKGMRDAAQRGDGRWSYMERTSWPKEVLPVVIETLKDLYVEQEGPDHKGIISLTFDWRKPNGQ